MREIIGFGEQSFRAGPRSGGWKRHPLGGIEWAWHFAFQDDVFPLRFNGGVRDGDGGEECSRKDGRLRDLVQGSYFRSNSCRILSESQCRTKVW